MTSSTWTTLGAFLSETGGSIKTGPFGTALNAAEYSGHGAPVISVGEIGHGNLRITERTRRVGPEIANRLPDYVLRAGDVVFGRKGAVDRSAIVRDSEDGYFLGSDGIRIRFGATVDPRFMVFQFQSVRVRDWLFQHAIGTTMPSLNQAVLERMPIRVPPIEEQHTVAQMLSDTDDHVGSLGNLIAKKRMIKQGVMQQLLSGRTRLPGFTDAWEHRRVEEVGNVLAGKALNVRGVGAPRPYLRTKNVHDGSIDLSDILWMPMTDSEFDRFRIENGDVLLNEGQSLELVGRCSIYSGEFAGPCTMQNQLLRFRAYSETSPVFVAHLFRYCQQTGVFASIATQTTSVAHLGSSRLSKLRLLWPINVREQTAIAAVLSDMDAEIAVLQERLSKIRTIQYGMMQKLLTARTRPPVQEPFHE